LWLAGLAALFVGERLFGAGHSFRVPMDALAAVLLLVAYFARLRSFLQGEGETRAAMGRLVRAYSAGLVGLAGYSFLAVRVGEDNDPTTIVRVLWPILLLAGTVPALFMELSLRSMAGGARLELRRLLESGHGGLALALCFSWLGVANWVAQEKDERIDLRSVRNVAPSAQTLGMVRNLSEPTTFSLMFPPANDVLAKVEPYFQELATANPNVKVETVDRDLRPGRAKELRARKNGVVVVSQGDNREEVRLDTEEKKARKALKDLDKEVQEAISKVGHASRVAYVVMGHGERSTSPKDGEEGGLKTVKEVLGRLNYKVKNLGVKEGLTEDVPKDATVVLLAGPTAPMMDAELQALVRYVQGGGALFLLADPEVDSDPLLTPLLDVLGLTLSLAPVVHDSKHVVIDKSPEDQRAIYSNRFTTHDSTAILSKLSGRGALIFDNAGSLDKKGDVKPAKEGGADVTFTVRSLAGGWADTDGDLAFDDGTEKKAVLNLVAAVELAKQDGADKAGKAVVAADADLIGDLLLPRVVHNQQFFADALMWLEGTPQLSGEVAAPEDVPLVHTRDQDRAWFYGTTLGVPLAVLGIGTLAVRRRRNAS
jgi:hypothetical protein